MRRRNIVDAFRGSFTALPAEATLDGTVRAMVLEGKSAIEHLPVVDDGRLRTVVGQRELMARRIEELEAEIEHLQEDINNLHNASQD